MNSSMYAIRPNKNFKNLFCNFVFTKNINSIAKNMHPIDPKEIHILSIEDTSSNSFPTFLIALYHRKNTA